ncbi:hypothetical protein MMC10_008937 [Thelotrema lepadinum]|nr:hypothetical protein [Thelotrema lepadinum]
MLNLDKSEVLRKFDALVAHQQIFYGRTETSIVLDQGFAVCFAIYSYSKKKESTLIFGELILFTQFEFKVCPALRSKPQLHDKRPGARVIKTNRLFQESDIDDGDPAFFISPVLDRHYLILNKFCVYRPQFLLLTSDPLQRQQDALTEVDIDASYAVLSASEQPMYAFFNCSAAAGSSRNHKHIQFLYQPEFSLFPWQRSDPRARVPYKYFIHRLDRHDSADESQGQFQASLLKMVYDGLLAQSANALGVRGSNDSVVVPHNVVMTREWMMVIPRRRAGLDGATANTAGMLGMVWVNDQAQLEGWMRLGPAKVLAELGVPSENP